MPMKSTLPPRNHPAAGRRLYTSDYWQTHADVVEIDDLDPVAAEAKPQRCASKGFYLPPTEGRRLLFIKLKFHRVRDPYFYRTTLLDTRFELVFECSLERGIIQ
jgi:hypothetical protein